jgi:hypothetical protein
MTIIIPEDGKSSEVNEKLRRDEINQTRREPAAANSLSWRAQRHPARRPVASVMQLII